RLGLLAFAAAVVAAPACSSTTKIDGTPDASAPSGDDAGAVDAGPFAGEDTQVVGFDKQPIFFDGADKNRTADVTVSCPGAGSYDKITMRLALGCPKGGCDHWDRFGTLGVVKKGAGENGSDLVIEIARFITPYSLTAKWDIDVTALRPLLAGDVTLRAFIDT